MCKKYKSCTMFLWFLDTLYVWFQCEKNDVLNMSYVTVYLWKCLSLGFNKIVRLNIFSKLIEYIFTSNDYLFLLLIIHNSTDNNLSTVCPEYN